MKPGGDKPVPFRKPAPAPVRHAYLVEWRVEGALRRLLFAVGCRTCDRVSVRAVTPEQFPAALRTRPEHLLPAGVVLPLVPESFSPFPGERFLAALGAVELHQGASCRHWDGRLLPLTTTAAAAARVRAWNRATKRLEAHYAPAAEPS